MCSSPPVVTSGFLAPRLARSRSHSRLVFIVFLFLSFFHFPHRPSTVLTFDCSSHSHCRSRLQLPVVSDTWPRLSWRLASTGIALIPRPGRRARNNAPNRSRGNAFPFVTGNTHLSRLPRVFRRLGVDGKAEEVISSRFAMVSLFSFGIRRLSQAGEDRILADRDAGVIWISQLDVLTGSEI